jgi:hypothetical protein
MSHLSVFSRWFSGFGFMLFHFRPYHILYFLLSSSYFWYLVPVLDLHWAWTKCLGRKGKGKAGTKVGQYLCIRVLGLCFGFALVVVGLQFDVCEREFDLSFYISYSYYA